MDGPQRAHGLASAYACLDVVTARWYSTSAPWIGRVAVSRELHPVPQTLGKVAYERSGILHVAAHDVVARNELRIRIKRDPCPHVANSGLALPRGCRNVLFLRPTEAPNLVSLQPFAGRTRTLDSHASECLRRKSSCGTGSSARGDVDGGCITRNGPSMYGEWTLPEFTLFAGVLSVSVGARTRCRPGPHRRR
jgi:hypothetical protein